jgi:hypothetical protein
MFLLYLDGGSGSYLIQVLVAGFAALVLYFNRIKYFILNLFRKKKPVDKVD